MNFRKINGVIRDSDKFMFDTIADNTFGNFLYQYYTTRKIPNLIFVNTLHTFSTYLYLKKVLRDF